MEPQIIEIVIGTEMITLGQFLKLANVISNGGEAKSFLAVTPVYVNGEQDQRRGRKLYNDFVVEVLNKKYLIRHDC